MTTIAVPAAPAMSRGRLIRVVLFLAVAAASVVVAILFAAHGTRVDTFPPYVAGATETKIQQFSGPWITGAFGLVALAGLLVVAAVADLRAPAVSVEESPVLPPAGPAGPAMGPGPDAIQDPTGDPAGPALGPGPDAFQDPTGDPAGSADHAVPDDLGVDRAVPDDPGVDHADPDHAGPDHVVPDHAGPDHDPVDHTEGGAS